MSAGERRHLVTLDAPIGDGGGDPVVFTPNTMWCAIRPSPPGAFDEQKVTHIVETGYHPQITFNTRLTHRGRSLYVRGVQNVDESNRDLVLLCEEVITP